MIKKVNILGTEYEVHLGVSAKDDESLSRLCGYCAPKSRKIVVADLNTVEAWKNEGEKEKAIMSRETIRHEVIHAFLAESGLWANSNDTNCWALNEEMIDWFAMQWPKIRKVFSLLECDEVE